MSSHSPDNIVALVQYFFMFQSKGITQQNLHGTFHLPHIVVAKLEHQMKRKKISCGSSKKGRGVKQSASSGALRKAAPMPKAAPLPQAASTLNKISRDSIENGRGARYGAREGGAPSNAINLFLRLFLYHFLHTTVS